MGGSDTVRVVLTSPSGRIKLVTPDPLYDEDVARLRSHPVTLRYLPFLPTHVSAEDTRKQRESRAKREAVLDLNILLINGDDEPKLVDVTGLFDIDRLNANCLVGILIHPDYFRSGLATRALYMLMKYAFEDDAQRMHRVVYETGADNVQMRGWLENVVGVQMEFRLREAWKAAPGKRVDAVGYSILEHEWKDTVKGRLEARLDRHNG
ncbi:hypothetical protein M0805_005892 [Coniferiporia weirii]|nr:hypothetical protein M0805_005892 [Coniferiporia weirii]